MTHRLAKAVVAHSNTPLNWVTMPISGEEILIAPNGTYAVLTGSRYGQLNPTQMHYVAAQMARAMDRMAEHGYGP